MRSVSSPPQRLKPTLIRSDLRRGLKRRPFKKIRSFQQPMKFADKYEILEMVTSGRVSTFLARERASQEAVVVYTFECAGTGASELSTASIISRFCALAPNPPGIIVKAGFDESSSSAFITTKMPEAVALKAWVGAYQSFAKPGTSPVVAPNSGPAAKPARGPAGDETAELSAEELRAFLAKSGPSKQPPVESASEDMGGVTAAFSLNTPPAAAPQSGGEFTRLFRQANTFEPVQSKRPATPPPAAKPNDATDAIFGEVLGGSPLGGHKPVVPPTPPKADPSPAEPAPGSFTREFLGLPGEKPTPAAEAWTPEPPKKEPGAFTREFMAVSQQDFQKGDTPARPTPPPQRPVSSPPQATSFESIFGPPAPPAASGGQAENQKSGAGEFTSFFRDPFESPGVPEKPIVVPDMANSAPTKPPVGDFTRMFGRDEISGMKQSSPTPPPEPEPPQASAGSFTQMFGQPPAGKKTPGSQPGQSTLGTNATVRSPFLEPSGDTPPPEAPRRATPVPSAPADSIFSRTPPSAPPVNQPFMTRPGSNEATDVFRIPGGDAPPMESAPSGPSEFTVFLSRGQVNAAMAAPPPGGPAMPAPTFAPPASPQPPPFQFTPPPAPAPPAPPAMRVPTAPAMPAARAPAAPQKAGGFWPLLVVLTVLLAIGAMLVMYFVLKH